MPLRLRQEVQALPRAAELTRTATSRPPQAQLEVVAGLITDASDRVLVGQRRAGTHMEGYWEFPGGKRRPGESPRGTLERELREELGIAVRGAEFMAELTHRYPDRCVRLEFWRVDRFDGEPIAREGQALKWVAPENLPALPLLPADLPLVEALLGRSAS